MINRKAVKKVILDPGGTFISSGPAFVWTVLGSCVSIVLYCPRLKISAICHAQLPTHSDYLEKCDNGCPDSCYKDLPLSYTNKFVTCAFQHMIKSLNRQGVLTGEIVASLYGGASRFGLKFRGKGIGERNVAVARQLLAKAKLKIKHEDTGGSVSRRLELDAESGVIKVTRIDL